MQGMAVGRAVDLMRFTTYGELYAKLEELFNLKTGEISEKDSSALEVVFTDDEDDIMAVGDDPWRYANFIHHFGNLSIMILQKRKKKSKFYYAATNLQCV